MILQSTNVWSSGLFLPLQLVLEGERIARVLPYNTRTPDVDYGALRVVPGLIDLHTHGGFGFDTNDARPEGLRDWLRRVPREGVTALLPTTVTQSPAVLEAAVANVARVAREGYAGAEILGVHLEGPYLDRDYRGAQPPEAVALPSVEQFRRYQDCAGGLIRYITLAPEHDRDHALIRYCGAHGVVVSMGHSSATFQEAALAAAEGVRSITHTFNGMTGLHHRTPGLAGASLRLRGVYGEIIPDGQHVHPAVLNLFLSAKGPDDSILITDSLSVKGCPPGGHYQLGGHDIALGEDGLARLKGTDTIAGSTLQMNQGLRIAVEEAQAPFETALNACTVNPARCLGLDRRKGRLCAGCDADIAVLRPDYQVEQTWCRGQAML